MSTLAVILFVLTYAGVAVGRLPGLLLDRTGIALLGAIAMIVCGILPLPEAVAAVDYRTIILLYALMVLSAQLRLGGFYTWVALQSGALVSRPRRFLAVSMLLSAGLSAILANDIICLAFTPVLVAILRQAGASPLPHLLGLAVASNIGSAATIIGNPQNMLIGQLGRLDFAVFLRWCAPPALLSLAAAYGVICILYRGQFEARTVDGPPPAEADWPAFNAWQSAKGLAATLVLMVLFFTSVPREYAALGVAGVLLCSRRMSSRQTLELIDWHLLSLFCALFVVIQGIEVFHVPENLMAHLGRWGIRLDQPLTLTAVSVVMSNLVSNVPAVLLLTRFLDPSQPQAWYLLAVSSTFAGNLLVIGSIANLIVIEQARRCGVSIGFATHARTGVPVTALSLLILVGWQYLVR
jgi:Na+/H+ antiporter NhaD/arsenite permease-like protein